MSEHQNEELNSNIQMTDAEEATVIEPQEELPASRQKVQMPLLVLALVAIGFAGNHLWANRTEFKALVGLEDEKPTCSLKAAGTCGNSNLLAASEGCSMKGEGQCPLTAGKSGCSSQAGLVVCTGSEVSDQACCTKMSAALAAALLEKNNHNREITEVDVEEPPAPAMPEDL